MNLLDELLAVVAEFDRDNVPFALCGGLAVAVHGHPRATKDIDFLLKAEDVERARTALKRAGFSLPALPMRFGRGRAEPQVIHRVSKILEGEPLTVDLIVAGQDLRDVFDAREAFEYGGRRIVTVSRLGLAKMKRLAGRPQDLADLDSLGMGKDDRDV